MTASRGNLFDAPWVVVTDLDTRSGIAGSRALAAAGYNVTGVAGERAAPGYWSRSCKEARGVTDPNLSRSGFSSDLESIVASGNHAALLPASDAALLTASESRERLEPHVALGFPPHNVVERVTDKLAVAASATAVGLAVPETALCASIPEAMEAAARLGFPLVVKGRRSVTATADDRLRGQRTRLVCDEHELRSVLGGDDREVLLQRSLDGQVWSVAGAIADGELLATAVSRYLRTWPPEGGCACFSETVAAPDALVESVRELLCDLGWQGIFEVELIQQTDGSFALIDLNPRLYGSLALAVRAGAPIPVVWTSWLRGERPSSVAARPGFFYRFEDADVRHAVLALRRGQVSSAVSTLRPRRRVAHAYVQVSDPGPFVGRVLQIFVRRVGLRRRGSVGDGSSLELAAPGVDDPADAASSVGAS